jgi:hypothetical protein
MFIYKPSSYRNIPHGFGNSQQLFQVPHPSSSNSMGIPIAISMLSKMSVGNAMP